MEIYPPVAWSYPFNDQQTRAKRAASDQAESCEAAEENIRNAFKTQIAAIRNETPFLPALTVNVNEGAGVQANIAKRSADGKCTFKTLEPSPLDVLVSSLGFTIVNTCTKDGYVSEFTPKLIEGSFISGETLTPDEWNTLATQLKKKLEGIYVIFKRDLTFSSPDHKIFSMTIQPPVSWSYAPEDNKARRARSTGVQANNLQEARQNVMSAFQKQMNDSLTFLKLPGVTVDLTKGLPLPAKIVQRNAGNCPAVTNINGFTVIVSDDGKNIDKVCDGNNQIPQKFELNVTGTFFPLNQSQTMSEQTWKKAAEEFQTRLRVSESVVFINNITLTDGVPVEATTVGATTTVTDGPTVTAEEPTTTTVEKMTVINKDETTTVPVDEEKTTETSTTVGVEETTTTIVPIEEAGEARTFSMKILPPVTWTYPYPKNKRLLLLAEGESNQAVDETAAMDKIKEDIESQLAKVTSDYKLPTVYFVINKGVPLEANIVVGENKKCPAFVNSQTTVVTSLNEKFIEFICTSTLDMVPFPPLDVTGSFYTAKESAPLGDIGWAALATELQTQLSALYVRFEKDLTIDVPEQKVFSMEIQPPVSWSYSPSSGLRRRPRSSTEQAGSKEEARENVLIALQSKVDAFVAEKKLATVKVDIIEGLPLPATIVDKCSSVSTGLNVLLTDSIIAQKCDETGQPVAFDVSVSGLMTSRNSSSMTDDVWKTLTNDLQKTLEETEGVVFRQNMTVKDRIPLFTTPVVTTTVEQETTPPSESTAASVTVENAGSTASTKVTEVSSSSGFSSEGTTESSTSTSNDPQGDAPQGNVVLIAADVPSSNDKEQATFVMAVQPPASWTYPSQPKLWRDDLQKRDEAEAREEIHAAIERAMHRVLNGYSIPEELLSVEISDNVKIAADIVDRSALNTCTSVSGRSVVLAVNGKTIDKSCSRNGKVKPYNLAYVRGTFKAELAASDDMWQILAVELKDQLETKENVVFPEGGRVIVKPL